jgi:hypothetical protein
MDETMVRVHLANNRVQALAAEARRCNDPERLRAIGDEIDLILANMRELREEQLIAQLRKPTAAGARPRRRWWRRRRSASP